MKLPLYTLLASLTTLLSCSHAAKKSAPPDYSAPPKTFATEVSADAHAFDPEALEENMKRDSSEAMRARVQYGEAALWSDTDPGKACALWLQLAARVGFPLAGVARVRAIEICPLDAKNETLSLDKIMAEPPEIWMSDEFSRAALKRAVEGGDKRWEMKLSVDVARSEPVQSAQIALLERSQSLAKELADTQALEQATQYLYQIAPRKIPDPQPAQYLSVAGDFKRAREFAKARDYYDKILASNDFTDGEKFRALDGVRMTFKLEKNTEKFLRSTRDYANFARWRFYEDSSEGKESRPAQLGHYLDAHISLARAIWTENSPRKAEEILSETEKDLKGRYPVDESVFLRARINEERGELDKTVAILEQIEAGHLVRDKALKAKVMWYRAWNLRKIGRLKEACLALQQLINEAETSPAAIARDRFWLARLYKETGDNELATKGFETLIESDPLGYYGALAYRELGRQLPPLSLPTPPAAPPALGGADEAQAQDDPLTASERVKLEWLLAVREDELGNRLLNSIPLSRRVSFSPETSFTFLRDYARTGSYQGLFARLGDLSADVRKTLLDKDPELIFPRRWKPLVDAAGEKFNVKQELIYSIIRQESSFNPKARSFADAFGLMQLIPEMAKRAVGATGVELSTNDDLYKPEVNIPLGTAFLRITLDRWKGAFIPTVASYNASEKAVSGWLKSRDRKDPLQFIEDVPYEETRTYLKLVMRNFVFYSRLNSRQEPIAFPEWCLADLQDITP